MKKTKQSIIKDYILDQLKSGELKKGDRILSENKLAEFFSVSRQTVRKAIYDLEKEGYLVTRRGSGTYVKSMRKDKENIGILTQSLTDYIFPFIVMGAEEALKNTKCKSFIGNAKNDPVVERETLERWMDLGLKGMIVDPVVSATKQANVTLLKEISEQIPTVIINSDLNIQHAGTLVLNDYDCGSFAAKKFIKLGHKRVAVIYKAVHKAANERANGFIDTIKEHKQILLYELPFHGQETSDEVFNLIMSLLSLPKNNIPTAIFCSNDLVAMQVIMAAKKLNLDIPNDISLIGFDDADFAQALEISTFRHPKQQFGEKAAQMLLKMIEENNNGKPEKIVEKAVFIERKSLIQKK